MSSFEYEAEYIYSMLRVTRMLTPQLLGNYLLLCDSEFNVVSTYHPYAQDVLNRIAKEGWARRLPIHPDHHKMDAGPFYVLNGKTTQHIPKQIDSQTSLRYLIIASSLLMTCFKPLEETFDATELEDVELDCNALAKGITFDEALGSFHPDFSFLYGDPFRTLRYCFLIDPAKKDSVQCLDVFHALDEAARQSSNIAYPDAPILNTHLVLLGSDPEMDSLGAEFQSHFWMEAALAFEQERGVLPNVSLVGWRGLLAYSRYGKFFHHFQDLYGVF